MASFNYKPSKPVALFSAAVGVGMIVFALVSFDEGPIAFIIFWCLAVVGIVGLNLWAAFSEKGSLGVLSDRGPAGPAGGGDGGGDGGGS